MRTLSLNLDLSDAEILRDAVEYQLRHQADSDGPRLVDHRMRSLRATLDELTQMIERPQPRRRPIAAPQSRVAGTALRRVH